jgi:hypothetical protein
MLPAASCAMAGAFASTSKAAMVTTQVKMTLLRSFISEFS